jgi:hypothetical protein
MIKKVFKYEIHQPQDEITLPMPKGAEILTVQEQKGTVCVWALVNPENETERRLFRMAGTGHPIHYDMGINYKYINTFQLFEGDLVFHLFEII